MFAHRNRPRVLLAAGTRPECLKLASLYTALARDARCTPLLVNSGQHLDMVERTFAHLGIACDRALPQLAPMSLSHAVRALREHFRDCARAERADLIVSQGDTSTAYAAALAARDLRVPLAHVEAGLRTDHPLRPFPEELFRRRIAGVATLHFAPTAAAADNLLREGIAAAAIAQVGNTAIDLLRAELESARTPALPAAAAALAGARTLITLTLHRRENYGRGLDVACSAVLELLAKHPELALVCPVHPNPAVGARVRRHLSAHPRVALVEPLDYRDFIALLRASRLAITDSGGIQEEAPHLGLPVLVVRENTERPESVALGCAHLVPLQQERIVAEAERMLAAPAPAPLPFTHSAPYGDGHAGARIAAALAAHLDADDLPQAARA